MNQLPVYLDVNGIILRLKNGRYYVSIIENGEGGSVKVLYVGPLEKIVKNYLEDMTLKVRPPGFEPGTSGLEGQRPNPG